MNGLGPAVKTETRILSKAKLIEATANKGNIENFKAVNRQAQVKSRTSLSRLTVVGHIVYPSATLLLINIT